MESKKVAVIGGGAAGFFAAISVKENHPNHEVILFEKTSKRYVEELNPVDEVIRGK